MIPSFYAPQECAEKTKQAQEYFDKLNSILKLTVRKSDYWQLLEPVLIEHEAPPKVRLEECPSYSKKPTYDEFPIENAPSYLDEPKFESKPFTVSEPKLNQKWSV